MSFLHSNIFPPILIGAVVLILASWFWIAERRFQAAYDREQIAAGMWPRDLKYSSTPGPSSYRGIKHWWNPFDRGY